MSPTSGFFLRNPRPMILVRGPMSHDVNSCRRQAEYCRQAALRSPPALAEEFMRLAETWMKLAEGLDPEALEKAQPRRFKKVG